MVVPKTEVVSPQPLIEETVAPTPVVVKQAPVVKQTPKKKVIVVPANETV